MSKDTERELLIDLKSAKKDLEEKKDLKKAAQKTYDKAESALIEFLEANEAVSTAKYEGMGYAQIQKPSLYASCKKEFEESLFTYLTSIDRADMIKTAVNAKSLSTHVSGCIEEGKEVPEFISYYFKPNVRIYPA